MVVGITPIIYHYKMVRRYSQLETGVPSPNSLRNIAPAGVSAVYLHRASAPCRYSPLESGLNARINRYKLQPLFRARPNSLFDPRSVHSGLYSPVTSG